jgi:malonyl-CoA O-methyltransferase
MDDHLKRAIRRSFERAATTYDEAAFLQQEVARRLDDHLEGVKVDPGLILDAGCGTGFAFDLLKARFPRARVIGLDIAHAMLCQARARHGNTGGWRKWLAPLAARHTPFAPLCADMDQLPLRANSIDMAWSSLALQWVDDLEATFRGVHRVMKPGGLFLFASFGPDTLKELRAASSGVDGHHHVNHFVDMHDVGDALVHAGFSHPVMEMEHLTLTYDELVGLMRDLKAIGAHTVKQDARNGLMGKAAWRRLTENYERFRQDGRLPATYEVVYGHAWAGAKDRLEDGRQIIQFQMANRKASRR